LFPTLCLAVTLASDPCQAASDSSQLPITTYAVNADCSRVAVVGRGRSVLVLSLNDGRPALRLGLQSQVAPGPQGDRIDSPEFSPDGDRLVTACADGKARVFDLSDGAELASFDAYAGGGSCRWVGVVAKWSKDGKRLLTYGTSTDASLWDVAKKTRIRSMGGEDGIVEHAEWGLDSNLIATATDQRVVRVWDGTTGEPRSVPMRVTATNVNGIALDPSGRRLAVGCGQAMAWVFDITKGEIEFGVSHKDDDWFGDLEVGGVHFSPDGKHLLTTTFSFHAVRSWDASNGREEWRTDFGGGNEGGITATHSPDGSLVFVNRRARMIDAKTGETKRQLADSCIVFYRLSPDGKHVLGVEGGSLHIWDAETLDDQWRITLIENGRILVDKAPVGEKSKH